MTQPVADHTIILIYYWILSRQVFILENILLLQLSNLRFGRGRSHTNVVLRMLLRLLVIFTLFIIILMLICIPIFVLFVFFLDTLHGMPWATFLESCLHHHVPFKLIIVLLLLRGLFKFVLESILHVWRSFPLKAVVHRLIHSLIPSSVWTLNYIDSEANTLILEGQIGIFFRPEIVLYDNMIV